MPKNYHAALHGVSVARALLKEPTGQALCSLYSALYEHNGVHAMDSYAQLCACLSSAGADSLGAWFDDRLRYEPFPYSEATSCERETPSLTAAARSDIQLFAEISAVACTSIKTEIAALLPDEWQDAVHALPEWNNDVPFSFESLTQSYRDNGIGMFARWRAFVWSKNRLLPVADPDFVPEEELWGYQLQRDKVVANTIILIDGRTVNNILLYGDAGTGKSATVKALLGMKGFEKLRLVEVHKTDLGDLGELLRTLAHRPQKFILFIDDLSFDKEDLTYSVLKSVLEGGLEPKPDNVAVYATSNRRTLVRQTFAERRGDEVNINETIQEKTSLAERFGIRIPYTALNRNQFLQMVEELAAIKGISYERESLHAQAIQWEMRHPSRTPRTALQFLASLNSN